MYRASSIVNGRSLKNRFRLTEAEPDDDLLGFGQFDTFDEADKKLTAGKGAVEKLLNQLLPKKSLHEYGVKPEEIRLFAESVMENQQRLLKNSFVPMTTELVESIYQSLY